MPLPFDQSDFEHEWRFHAAVHDLILSKAKRLSGCDWDWLAWGRVLRPAEFDLLLISFFIGVWENEGRFIDAAKCWDEERELVARAFRRLGFNVASVLLPRALELENLRAPYLNNDLPLPDDLATEVDRVNDAAAKDVSEARITRAICEQAEELDL